MSEVLAAVRLTGAVFLEMTLRERWSYLTAPARAIAEVLMPDADHVIPYHLVTAGACYARLLNGRPVALQAGDVILFPAGDRHVLAAASRDALALRPVDLTGESLQELLQRGAVEEFSSGTRGATTRIVCGFLACDARLAAPIIRSLPRLLRVRLGGTDKAAWMASSIRLSVRESAARRPGSAMVLARLSEVLFAEAVRQHMESHPAPETGWLGALKDRFIGKALARLHENPRAPWTVAQLAREVGLSRSALGERFTAMVGAPPMQYLARWRVALAASRLRHSDASIRSIAHEVGYASEAAFIRVFKKEYGTPPAAWRRRVARAAA
ncbi:MAG: AraC family transcriptional regulator [Gammaproteobacteria bacterium]|nr:AraC family transcriptional regulator [Gammaproteobacteria bacterium]